MIKMSKKRFFLFAHTVAIGGMLLLFGANGAVGIIGSESQPANRLFVAVFAVWLVGASISRFKAKGMTYTMFMTAIVQLSMPFVALVIYPTLSWGAAGMMGVFILNAFFALVFIFSGLLFRKSRVVT